MKNRIGSALAMAVIAAMLCSVSAVYGYEGGDSPKDETKRKAHFDKMAKDLNLTPQQQEQLTKDREEYAAKSKGLWEKMKAARADLKAELDKPAPDKARLNSLIAETKELVGQKMQNKVDKIMAMKKVLTPEQFKKMGESMKDRKQGKHGKDDKKCDKSGDAACGM